MKYKIAICFLFFISIIKAQKNEQKDSLYLNKEFIYTLDSVIASFPALPYFNLSTEIINKQKIAEKLNAVDIPLLLNQNIGVVSSSNAGNGVGYSDIRIRNIDASRIQVSINGIPFNDAESAQAYWVDIPALANAAKSITIQRGLNNTSLNNFNLGAGIDINTNVIQMKPNVEANFSIGSYKTYAKSIAASSGLLNNNFFAEIRLSQIKSDGYIDRAASDLKSYFISLCYKKNNHEFWFNTFGGNEKTYQAWNGVPFDSLKTNRTFNVFNYENQTDNYYQKHYQLHYLWNDNKKLSLQSSMFIINGTGYYEEFKENEALNSYGLTASIIGNDTFYNSNIIRRKWLENAQLGINTRLKYNINSSFTLYTGAAFSSYFGKHFDEIIWMQYVGNMPQKITYNKDYANKNDVNYYLRLSYNMNNKWIKNIFIENQIRKIIYDFNAKDTSFITLAHKYSPIFVNPKIGISFKKFNYLQSYLFAGISHKEPNRDDFINSTYISRPKHETLYNIEYGLNYKRRNGFEFTTNLYYMYYVNQLTLNGKINDVGEYTRTNIPKSYRLGWENAILYERKNLQISANLTFSLNKSIKYTEFIDDYDSGVQIEKNISNADLAYAPKIIFNNETKYQLLKNKLKHNIYFGMINKYVSKQNIDNYSSDKYILHAYFITDFYVLYAFNLNKKHNISFKLSINNAFNTSYETFAWVYKYKLDNEIKNENGYFPQAKRNIMFSAYLKLNN